MLTAAGTLEPAGEAVPVAGVQRRVGMNIATVSGVRDLSVPADRFPNMIPMDTRTDHAHVISLAGTARRTGEARTLGGAAPVRVVPLWQAPCAHAAQGSAKH